MHCYVMCWLEGHCRVTTRAWIKVVSIVNKCLVGAILCLTGEQGQHLSSHADYGF
jgi:hypothetical protein